MAEGVLDETSRKILRLLQTEPELTVAEVAVLPEWSRATAVIACCVSATAVESQLTE